MQQKPTTRRDEPSDDRATRTASGSRDRGVSEIIGAILLFGLLVAVLVLVQANAVPDANKQLEFQHNERLHGDFVDLDADLEATAATGNGRATVVETGLRYPPRFFLFNPPPASGSIRTADSEFTIRNAVAQGNDETADYWDGGTADPNRFDYESRSLSYSPNYNVYAGAPVTTYTHGAVVNEFEDGTIRPVDDAAFVSGRTISLIALDGDRDFSQVEPSSVDATPLSTDTRTVRVTDNGSPIVITIQTDLSETAWRELLADQFTSEGGNVVSVSDGGSGTIDVTLQQGVIYELQLAKLGVGPGADTPEAAYMTTDIVDGVALETNRGSTLTVEVRDAFNGPVAGEDVTFEAQGGEIIDGGAVVTTTTVTTNEQGEASVQFVPEINGNPTLIAKADLNGDNDMDDPEERVEIDVDPRDEGTDDNTLNPIGTDTVLRFEQASVVTQGQDYFVDIEFENGGNTPVDVSAARVNFFFTGSTGAAPSRPDEPDTAVLTSLGGEELDIRGAFETVSWTIGPQGDTLRVEFTGPPQNQGPNASDNYETTELDFFILTVEYPDGRVSSYIIGPE